MDMAASSNRIINAFPPLNNITPFTRVDGWSFLEVLEGLRNYIVNTLVPEIDGDFEKITDQLNEWFEQYTKDFSDLKLEWQTLFDEFMSNIVVELEGLNDQAISNLINNELSETKKALNNKFIPRDDFTTLDISKVRPHYVSNVTARLGNVIQSMCKEPISGDMYVSQATSLQRPPNPPEGSETTFILRNTAGGEYRDHMLLVLGGHGSKITVENDNGVIYIWMSWRNSPDGSGARFAHCRFPYLPGESLDRNDPRVKIYTDLDNTGDDYSVIAPNFRHDTIAIRHLNSSGNIEKFILRKLSEYKAGIGEPIKTLTMNVAGGSFQSMDADSKYLYVTRGNGYGRRDQALSRYNWSDSLDTYSYDLTYLADEQQGSQSQGDMSETEACSLFYDPQTGAQHLFISKSIGPGGARTNIIYCFSPLGQTGFLDMGVSGNRHASGRVLSGWTEVIPVPNEPTEVRVTFPPGMFTNNPIVVASARSTVVGTSILGVSALGASRNGFNLIVLRTNAEPTNISWIAHQTTEPQLDAYPNLPIVP